MHRAKFEVRARTAALAFASSTTARIATRHDGHSVRLERLDGDRDCEGSHRVASARAEFYPAKRVRHNRLCGFMLLSMSIPGVMHLRRHPAIIVAACSTWAILVEAERRATEALAVYEQMGDPWGLAESRLLLAQVGWRADRRTQGLGSTVVTSPRFKRANPSSIGISRARGLRSVKGASITP